MENIKIQKALKGMVDHMVILNDDEILSSSTLATMAIDALCEDSEYCDLVDRDSAEAYLCKIVNFLDSKGLSFYDTNILEIEICSQCGVILLPDDECYQDQEIGLALCDKCSVQCRGCGNAIASSKIADGEEYYCATCNAIPSLDGMSLDQFEKHDGNFTFSTKIKLAIGQGFCLPNGMVHCKVEGAYEKFFASRKDAFENIVKQNHYVPHAYLELNNGFDKSLLECFNSPKAVHLLTDANNHTTRQLLEKEFQNVPNSTHKDNLMAEALQLVEVNGYTVGEAANEVLAENTSFVGLPELFSIRDTFLTYVGEWTNGKECRTGENREDGTVTYLMDGLYLYEFKTREDAFKYLFDDDRTVPYAMAEYDEELTEANGECSFGEWEFHNGFDPLWLDSKEETKSSFAWEVTDDDIALALQEMGLPNGNADIQEVRGFLDCDAVEHAALKSDTLEKQSANALEEIINQINQNF